MQSTGTAHFPTSKWQGSLQSRSPAQRRALPRLCIAHTALKEGLISPAGQGRSDKHDAAAKEPLEGTGRDPAFGHCIHARQWQRARQIHITRMILQANAAETITAVNGLMVRLGCFVYLPQNMGDGCVLRPATYRRCSLGVCKEQASSSNFPFAVSKLPSTGKRC